MLRLTLGWKRKPPCKAEGGVELDAVAAVHLRPLSSVHATRNMIWRWFDDAFENAVLLVLGVLRKSGSSEWRTSSSAE
ncbi:MAG: hypothetical protein ACLU6O_00230 [Bilophila wadsworthia]